jgi:heat shock protein HslJ
MTPLRRAASAAVVLVALLAACSPAVEVSPSPSPPGTLAGSSWRAVSVDGASPVEGSEPTLVFAADEVSGTTGCNQFFGPYTYGDGSISFGLIGMTMMACEGPVGTVEAAYTAALDGASSVSFDDAGQLLLSGTGGDVLFVPDSTSSR